MLCLELKMTALLLLSVFFVDSNCFHTSQIQHTYRNKRSRHDALSWRGFNRVKAGGKRHLSVCASISDGALSEKLPTSSSPSPETIGVLRDFLSLVKESIHNQVFVSFTLRGPSVPEKGKHKGDKERLRGCIRQVQGRLIVLNKKKKRGSDQVFLQATIKYHGATDVAKNWKVDDELVELEQGLSSLLLSSSLSNNGNVVLSEWGERGLHPGGSEMGIQGGELCTSQGTWELDASYRESKPKEPKLRKRQKSKTVPSSDDVAPGTHDRTKQVPLSSDAPFLQALGLTKADGKPRRAMSSKLKQCQKFVEIVGGLVETSLANTREISCISVVDMGCGRGYLTFSLHSHLVNKYGSNGIVVQSRGIDVRPKLVKEMIGFAGSLGPEFAKLTFEEGTIEGALSSETGRHRDNSLDVLIALHACDTATDDALWSGIQSMTDVLVVAPCCHKEVRRQLDPYVAKVGKVHPLADVLRHNIYRERMAETATDSIRALLLEIANYNVQVFEFIGGEHTSKNVMITATKRKRARTTTELDDLRQRLRSLSALHGIQKQRLADWIGEKLSEDDASGSKNQLSSKSMPPL